jgi:hypothetical protein
VKLQEAPFKEFRFATKHNSEPAAEETEPEIEALNALTNPKQTSGEETVCKSSTVARIAAR